VSNINPKCQRLFHNTYIIVIIKSMMDFAKIINTIILISHLFIIYHLIYRYPRWENNVFEI